jgi:hypothetical protein
MPIQLNEVETQVDVEAPASSDAPPAKAPAEWLTRWQELARRDVRLAERTAAWGFDD